jgi:hypothetical protein
MLPTLMGINEKVNAHPCLLGTDHQSPLPFVTWPQYLLVGPLRTCCCHIYMLHREIISGLGPKIHPP